jgi:hypothetical protein
MIVKVLTNVIHPELQLQNETVSYCRKMLHAGADLRKKIRTLNDWMVLREKHLERIRSVFPPILFERKRPLNTRAVSKYEFYDCRVENVIFESLPGWEVNGTVYLPKKPGVYPGCMSYRPQLQGVPKLSTLS